MQQREILVHQEADMSEVGTTNDTMECCKLSREPGVSPKTMLNESGALASRMLCTQQQNPTIFTQNVKKVEDETRISNKSPISHEVDLIKSTVSQTDSSNNHTMVYHNLDASHFRHAKAVSTNQMHPAHIVVQTPKELKTKNSIPEDTEKLSSDFESTSMSIFSNSHLQITNLQKKDFSSIRHDIINMETVDESIVNSSSSEDEAQNPKSNVGFKTSITEMLTSICSLSLIFGYILWRIKKINASPKFQIYIITFGSGLLLYLSDLVSDIMNGLILILVKGN